MVVAYLNNGKPEAFGAIAVHAFNKTPSGKTIKINQLCEDYQLTEQEARQVYEMIIKLFPSRTLSPKMKGDKYRVGIKRKY